MATDFSRPWLAVCLCTLALSFAACRKGASKVETEEEPSKIASVLPMSDPRALQQLQSGFYGLEANTWRWTAQKFTVSLGTPRGAATGGARLVFKLSVPNPVIVKLKSVTLTATVGATALPPQTYDKPGNYVYEQAVPAAALPGPTAVVEFALDRALPPNPPDVRQLGVIANSVALLPAQGPTQGPK